MQKLLTKILVALAALAIVVGTVIGIKHETAAAGAAAYIFLNKDGKPIGESDDDEVYPSDAAIILESVGSYYAVIGVVDGAEVGNVVLPYPTKGSTSYTGLYGYGIEAIDAEAFKGSSIKSIVIPKTVGNINDKAFSGCTELTSVSFTEDNNDYRLTALGASIFEGCTSLYSFYVPSTVTKPSTKGFLKGSSINTIIIGSGTTEIPSYLCYSGSALTDVIVKDKNSIVTIKNNAFMYCTSLSDEAVANLMTPNLNLIGQSAFSGCEGITKVTFPSNLEKINSAAFDKCKGLQAIDIPGNVKVVGAQAFNLCESVTTLTIREGVEELDNKAFTGTAITSVTIPASVVKCTSSGTGPFYGTEDLETVVFAGKGNTIPASVLAGATAVNSVTIPSTITIIGDTAFKNCAALTTLNGLEKVETIGKEAFSGTGMAGDIALTKCVVLGDKAFYNCKDLTSVTFGTVLNYLGAEFISGNELIESVIVPASVTSCGANGPFKNTKVTSAEFKGTEIPSYLFKAGDMIETINLGTNITKVGDGAFEGCQKYAGNPTFSKVTYFGKTAFKGCDFLDGAIDISSATYFGDDCFYALVEVPFTGKFNAVTNFGKNAFYGCSGLCLPVDVSKAESVKVGDYAFFSSGVTSFVAKNATVGKYSFSVTPITKIVITGDNKLTIGDYAFAYCTEVTTLDIGKSGITTIGNFAFYGLDKVKSFEIPANVTKYGAGAFGGTAISSISIPYAKGMTVTVAENKQTALWHGPFTVCANLTKIEFEEGYTNLPPALFYHFCSSKDAVIEITLPSTAESLDPITTSKPYPLFGKNIAKSVKVWIDNEDQRELAQEIIDQFVAENETTNYSIELKPHPLKSISLNMSETTIKETESQSLVVRYNPSNTTDPRTVIWTSSDKTVATVDAKGNVSALKAGSTVITAKVGTCTAKCTVTVIPFLDPTTITTISNGTSGVTFKWDAVDGAGRYDVYRATSRTGTYTKVGATTATNYLDKNVKGGVTYFYKVVAASGTKASADSNIRGTIFVGTPDITLRVNRAVGIGLRWDKIEGATGYAIYRKPYYGNSAWVRVATIEGGNVVSWDDTSVKNENGEVFKYTIRALAGSDLKTMSGCRETGRTMVRLSSVSITSLVKTAANAIKGIWTKNSMATGYEVRLMVGDKVYKTFTYGNCNTIAKTISGLPTGCTYKVQVRSYRKVDGVGSFYSAWSVDKKVYLK